MIIIKVISIISYFQQNTLEIDSLLSSPSNDIDNSLPLSLLRSSSKLEKSISKKSGPSGKSLKFTDITSSRFLEPEVKSASSPLGKDDITVSYESRPSGGFSVFYTVPKEPLEASKMDKIKNLIQSINKKTLLNEDLTNSVNDYEDDYYEDDEYESDYYEEDPLTDIRTLKHPPDISDDYYDPGPPASYYDDVPEYLGDEDDEYDDYDYDYDDDYEDDYYDVAENRMMVESSTMNPTVLSPTVQKLNALTQKQLGSHFLHRLKKARKKKKKSIDRSFDTKGKNKRPKRWALRDVHISNIVNTNLEDSIGENNAIDLSNIDNNVEGDNILDPSLYEVSEFDFPNDPIMGASEYTPYIEEEYVPYLEEDDIFYDDDFEEDYFPSFGRKKEVPIVQRTWLDNVLKYRDSLFGTSPQYKTEAKKNPTYGGGKPQVNIHYPDSNSGPLVTITEANRKPLENRPNIFLSGGAKTRAIPPVVAIQRPNSVISSPATSISRPATTISQPATTISQPAVSISKPAITISQPATTISQPALSIQTPEFDFSQPAVDFVNTPDFSIRNQQPSGGSPLVPSNINTLNTLGRLRIATGGGRNPVTTTRILGPDDIPEEGLDHFLSEEYDDDEHYHSDHYHHGENHKLHYKKEKHHRHYKKHHHPHHHKHHEHHYKEPKIHHYSEPEYHEEIYYHPQEEEYPPYQGANPYHHKHFDEAVEEYLDQSYHGYPEVNDRAQEYKHQPSFHHEEEEKYDHHNYEDPHYVNNHQSTYKDVEDYSYDNFHYEEPYEVTHHEDPYNNREPTEYHTEYDKEKMYDPYQDQVYHYEHSQQVDFDKHIYEEKQRNKYIDHSYGAGHTFDHSQTRSYEHPHLLPKKHKTYMTHSVAPEKVQIPKEPHLLPRKHFKHKILAPPTAPVVKKEEYHHSTSAIYQHRNTEKHIEPYDEKYNKYLEPPPKKQESRYSPPKDSEPIYISPKIPLYDPKSEYPEYYSRPKHDPKLSYPTDPKYQSDYKKTPPTYYNQPLPKVTHEQESSHLPKPPIKPKITIK